MRPKSVLQLVVVCGIFLAGLCATAQVVAVPPYTVTVFTKSITGVDFAPDSIAILNGNVYIGYGDGVAPDGSDGKSSTIVEYTSSGKLLTTYTVLGHNDGLRVNPNTNQLWAMQNEDANPNLVIIDPTTQTQTMYTFGPTPHGGGYDDIAFSGNNVYLSASNPANNPNTKAAIVQATIVGNTVSVTPVLYGNAKAINIPLNTSTKLNLQDPDSMIIDSFGDILLDSQADAELIVVHNPGLFNQSVWQLPLTENGAAVQIDDTVFSASTHGSVLVSDRDGETVYAISRNIFLPGIAYCATPTTVAVLNKQTGVLTDVVTGMVSPHGMAFLSKE